MRAACRISAKSACHGGTVLAANIVCGRQSKAVYQKNRHDNGFNGVCMILNVFGALLKAQQSISRG
jgi:hypothetical protein